MNDTERLAHLKSEKDRVLISIQNIEQKGWRLYETRGDDVMMNVTAERLAERMADVQMLDHLLEAWNSVCT